MPKNKGVESANLNTSETDKNLKIVVKGAGLIFVGLVFSKILTYFYRLIVARYYGPEDYGLISIGLSVIGVLVVILVLGMDVGIVRYVSEYKAKKDEKKIKGSILAPFRISLPLSIAAAILFWVFSPHIAGIFAKDAATQLSLTIIFQVFSLTIPFTVMYKFLLAANSGLQKIKYNVYTDNIFYSIILVSTAILFSFLGFNIGGIAWSYTITVIVSFIFIFWSFNKKVFNIFSGVKPIFENQKFLKYSIPLFIGSTASIVIGSFDTIILGVFTTANDVGFYNAALPTAKFIAIFGAAFSALFAPIVIGYKTRKMNRNILTLYRTLTKWIFFVGFPFVLLLVFFSRNILNFLFGPEYVSAPTIFSLSILGVAFFIESVLILAYVILFSIDKTKYRMVNIILAALINIILNIVLIPHYGILGAAISTSISVILAVSLDSFFVWKFTRMFPLDFRAIFKSVFAGLSSLTLVFLLYRYVELPLSIITFLPALFSYLLLYFVLLLIFRALDRNDIYILTEIEKSGIRIKFIRRFFKRFVR